MKSEITQKYGETKYVNKTPIRITVGFYMHFLGEKLNRRLFNSMKPQHQDRANNIELELKRRK